jgi:hypothetical protein
MKKHLITKILMLAGIVGLGATDAAAIDSYRAAGATCYKVGGNGSLGVASGMVFNFSTTSTVDVACPLLRDAASIANGNVQVFDRHATMDVSCTIVSSSMTGATDSRSVSTSGSQAGVYTLPFTGIPAVNTDSFYWAVCTIPPAHNSQFSHIARFLVNEN